MKILLVLFILVIVIFGWLRLRGQRYREQNNEEIILKRLSKVFPVLFPASARLSQATRDETVEVATRLFQRQSFSFRGDLQERNELKYRYVLMRAMFSDLIDPPYEPVLFYPENEQYVDQERTSSGDERVVIFVHGDRMQVLAGNGQLAPVSYYFLDAAVGSSFSEEDKVYTASYLEAQMEGGEIEPNRAAEVLIARICPFLKGVLVPSV